MLRKFLILPFAVLFVGIAFADSPPIEPEAVKVSFVMHYSHHNYPIFYPMIPPCEHGPQICTGSQLEANCCQPFQNKCRDHGIARLVQVHSDGTFTYSLIYGGDAAQKLTSGDTTVPKSLAKSDGTQSTAKPNSTSTIYILGQNYPNPVCGKTLITYSIPARAYFYRLTAGDFT
ncbi:MAG TPA: hypothetical protein EYP60_07810, partial [bacterium (Candidatus Stahlbacteria)]|nr:hypothetical protein [Candidatus Stahlbacteria bacterium]